MEVPWHLLIHTASILAAGYGTPTVGVDTPTYSTAVPCPCRVEESGSQRTLDDQRITGTWTAIGYFPISYGGNTIDIPKDCKISVTGPGLGNGKTYKVVGPARNVAGAGVLFAVALEATT